MARRKMKSLFSAWSALTFLYDFVGDLSSSWMKTFAKFFQSFLDLFERNSILTRRLGHFSRVLEGFLDNVFKHRRQYRLCPRRKGVNASYVQRKNMPTDERLKKKMFKKNTSNPVNCTRVDFVKEFLFACIIPPEHYHRNSIAFTFLDLQEK